MKAEATLKIKPRRENLLRARGLRGLYELVFYRKPSLGSLAMKLVTDVEGRQSKGDPMRVSEWKKWVAENRSTQRQFYDVVSKLAGVGMLRRERACYLVVGDFSKSLRSMADVWDARTGLYDEEIK